MQSSAGQFVESDSERMRQLRLLEIGDDPQPVRDQSQ